MPLLDKTPTIQSYLEEPSLSVAGLGVETDTATDTVTFLWDSDDGDTDVVMERERGFDATGNLIRQEVWSFTNEPTITGIVTDQGINTTVTASGVTELTITGTNYGAQDADISVVLFVQPRVHANSRSPGRGDNRTTWEASDLTISGPKTEIVCNVDLSVQQHPYKVPQIGGTIEVVVYSKKRRFKSAPFTLTVVE